MVSDGASAGNTGMMTNQAARPTATVIEYPVLPATFFFLHPPEDVILPYFFYLNLSNDILSSSYYIKLTCENVKTKKITT
jgi:hypothetical protein